MSTSRMEHAQACLGSPVMGSHRSIHLARAVLSLAVAACSSAGQVDPDDRSGTGAGIGEAEPAHVPGPATDPIVTFKASLPSDMGQDIDSLLAFPITAGLPWNGGFDERTPTRIRHNSIEFGINTVIGAAPSFGTPDSHVVALYEADPDGDRSAEAATMLFLQLRARGVGTTYPTNFYTSLMSPGTFDLGTLEVDSAMRILKAERAISANTWDLEEQELLELAQSDLALRRIRNDYALTNPTTAETIRLQLRVGARSREPLSVETWTPSSGFEWQDYGMTLESTRQDIKLASLCQWGSSRSKTLELRPPNPLTLDVEDEAGVQHSYTRETLDNSAASSATGSSSESSECSSDTGFLARETPDLTAVEWDKIRGPPTVGSWELAWDQEVIGTLDVAMQAPHKEGQDSIVRMIVPQVRIVQETAVPRLRRVDVTFALADDSGRLIPLDTLSPLGRLVSDLTLSLANDDDLSEGHPLIFPESGTTFEVSASNLDRTWYLSGSETQGRAILAAVRITFEMFGNRYEFEWEWPTD